MAVDQDIIGREAGPWTRSWTADDALLYAVAVGAGQDDPTTELAFTTENTVGVEQRALPTYAIVLAQFGGPRINLGDVDLTGLLHAEQALTLYQPLPVAGTVELTAKVTELWDKGSGALVATETAATDTESGEPVFATRSAVFLRGEGGFGGDRGPSMPAPIPQRPVDTSLNFRTAVNQALLYRLTGDRNPLHSDPKYAAAAGFRRPILHGLATYGITARLLIDALCDGDPDRLTYLDGRFTKPVTPGDELVVEIWHTEEGAAFRTRNALGEVVLDRGRVAFS